MNKLPFKLIYIYMTLCVFCYCIWSLSHLYFMSCRTILENQNYGLIVIYNEQCDLLLSVLLLSRNAFNYTYHGQLCTFVQLYHLHQRRYYQDWVSDSQLVQENSYVLYCQFRTYSRTCHLSMLLLILLQ